MKLESERALHTVLATCQKPYYPTLTIEQLAEQLKNRLDEIRQIVEPVVLYNAKSNAAERLSHEIMEVI